MQAIGATTPIAAVLPLLIAAMALAPLCPSVERRPATALAAMLLVLAAGVALWVRLDPIALSVAVYSNDK
jgi:MFS superfamily sulfate permease-like transporter